MTGRSRGLWIAAAALALAAVAGVRIQRSSAPRPSLPRGEPGRDESTATGRLEFERTESRVARQAVERASQAFRLRGIVLDRMRLREDGQRFGVGGAEIRLLREDPDGTRTLARNLSRWDGEFELGAIAVPRGRAPRLVLTASHDDYETHRAPLDIGDLAERLEIRLDERPALRGRVVDPVGAPAAGAAVMIAARDDVAFGTDVSALRSVQVIAGDDGAFEWTERVDPPARLLATSPRLGTALIDVTALPRNGDLGTITLQRGAVLEGLVLLCDGTPFEGRLDVRPDGVEPAPAGTTVRIYSTGLGWREKRLSWSAPVVRVDEAGQPHIDPGSAVSDASGHVRLGGLAPGRYWLQARSDDGTTHQRCLETDGPPFVWRLPLREIGVHIEAPDLPDGIDPPKLLLVPEHDFLRAALRKGTVLVGHGLHFPFLLGDLTPRKDGAPRTLLMPIDRTLWLDGQWQDGELAGSHVIGPGCARTSFVFAVEPRSAK